MNPIACWRLVGKPLLAVALGIYVVCLICLASPPTAFRSITLQLLKPYFTYLGLLNHFAIMAPNVLDCNNYYRAKIEFADGTATLQDLPAYREGSTTDWEHQRLIFYFDWQWHFADPAKGRLLLTDACRYLARVNRNAKNEPRVITLYRIFMKTAPPTENLAPPGQSQYSSEMILTYYVRREDLE